MPENKRKRTTTSETFENKNNRPQKRSSALMASKVWEAELGETDDETDDDFTQLQSDQNSNEDDSDSDFDIQLHDPDILQNIFTTLPQNQLEKLNDLDLLLEERTPEFNSITNELNTITSQSLDVRALLKKSEEDQLVLQDICYNISKSLSFKISHIYRDDDDGDDEGDESSNDKEDKSSNDKEDKSSKDKEDKDGYIRKSRRLVIDNTVTGKKENSDKDLPWLTFDRIPSLLE